MRRTQRERREATIARLLDASIATIDEIGYARTSVNEIAARAGLSYGALFRHFDSMSDFMAATARETVRRHTRLVVARVREVAGHDGRGTLETTLQVLRELAGHPTHTVVLELTNAARTDTALREHMRRTMTDVAPEMIEAAQQLVGHNLDLAPGDFATLVFMIVDLFDAEAFQHPLREQHPEINQRRIPLLLKMLAALSPQPQAGSNSLMGPSST
ncbi:hypothetical protein AWN90_04460 [Nocardia terpenica]|uniref:HTH tetR-type domain-containing protein n=1 Tax=Nocardia terpenica TaxID=455432 RepID=A0A164IYL0_9NOCA|nr:hypothetical protein AWN90_04460 [Nocardia terpenica]NQE91228.1 TetR/AcrR family transcriptional regulator [Nocardia terpenica]